MMRVARLLFLAGILSCVAAPSLASDWPAWRGPSGNGISSETGLITNWSKDGTNLLWSQPFTGRSTPIVLGRRVCANGRVGEGIHRQETVACFDLEEGRKLWEHRFNVHLTTVPWNRVGWANIAGDPETGYIYVQGVGGALLCLDSAGKVVWSRSLLEDFGFFSGYGGRTQTPVVDEDRLIVTFVSGSWGTLSAPRHRTFAFDKKTGELLWVATPGERPPDLNTQSTPAVATIEGQRLLIQGNADGSICAIQARTGKSVWRFRLSKRGLNTSVLVENETVYATHSEENIGGGVMGAVVAIDATGAGDVTDTHEQWRTHLSIGFSSPLFKNGRLYVVDNSANLHCLDASSGTELWDFSLGTVGKGSPVWADGKIFVTEVNGRFHILEIGDRGARSLDEESLTVGAGRRAEIYGSPAIAQGRIFFTTEDGIYAIGDPSTVLQPAIRQPEAASIPQGRGDAAMILAVPAEVRMHPGEKRVFQVQAFNKAGRPLGERQAEWSLVGLDGLVNHHGEFEADSKSTVQVGVLEAKLGSLTAQARVRVFGGPELEIDFQSTPVDQVPDYFLGARIHFKVQEDENGNRFLVKNPAARSIHRHRTLIGPSDWSNYTIEADLRATRTRRLVPDMGLINGGYTLDVMGAHQQIQLRSWTAERRMAVEVPFQWEADRWYRIKLRVDPNQGNAVIRGKVWLRESPEPEDWTIVAQDPHPVRHGSPALYAYSPTPVYFDNVKVTRNR